MSRMDILVVEQTSNNNCFVSLPKTWSPAQQFKEVIVYEIELKSRKIYVSCQQYHENNSQLKINGLFAQKLGICHGDSVVISEYENPVQSANEVFVAPLTRDDWEVIELNSEVIQNELLNQLRIVWVDMIFPFWVHNSVCVFLKVYKLNPDSEPCLLESRASVSVSPDSDTISWSRSSFTDHSSKSPSTFDRSLSVENSVRSSSNVFEPEHSTLTKHSSLPDVASKESSSDDADHSKSLNPELLSESFLNNSIWASIKYFVSPRRLSHFSDLSFLFEGNRKFDENLGNSVNLILKVMAVNPELKHRYSTRHKCFNYVYISRDVLKGQVSKPQAVPTSFVAVLKTTMNRHERYIHGLGALDKSKGKAPKEVERFVPQSLVVRVIIVPEEISKQSPRNFIMCSIVLRQQLGLKLSNLVRLSSVASNPADVNKLVLYPFFPLKATPEAVTAAFYASILESHESNQPQLFSSGSIVEIFINDENQNCTFVVDILCPEHQDPLYSYLLQYHKLEIKIESLKSTPSRLKFPHKELKDLNEVNLNRLGAIENYKFRCLNFLKLVLGIGPLASHLNDPNLFHGHPIQEFGGLLITGPSGCGKTSLARGLIRELHHSSSCVSYEVIECKKHQGKKSDSIKNLLLPHYCEAADCHPSIILLEDIDLLFPSESEEQATSTNATDKMVKEFMDLITQPLSPNVRITIMATSQSTATINSRLISSNRHFLFREVVEIKTLDKEGRREVLEMLMLNNTKVDKNSITDVDLTFVTERTEGFVASDLQTIIDRAIHSASSRMAASSQLLLADFDFVRSLEGFESLLSSKVKVSSSGDKTLKDVGGLAEVKRALNQTLLLPIQYPKLFASCPIRLRSGILLYGPPGTGKTLIAGAIAKTCNMNFISIKGPEVFSKYIGASEQIVRQLFLRAESAKPCILFFDEFDSIAPRRGHNIAGVTDRVVNQLLTQMDGFEERDGVYVLAATSRPEMIDSALLRPGRLDKSLYCPLPNKDERLEILECLSRNLILDENIDFDYIANNTDNYSGADLHSILGTAQINAIHESVEKCRNDVLVTYETDIRELRGDIIYLDNFLAEPTVLDPSKHHELIEKIDVIANKYSLFAGKPSPRSIKSQSSPPAISQQNLLDSLAKSRPSISESDLKEYNSIYGRFGKKIPDHNETVISHPQRMTYA